MFNFENFQEELKKEKFKIKTENGLEINFTIHKLSAFTSAVFFPELTKKVLGGVLDVDIVKSGTDSDLKNGISIILKSFENLTEDYLNDKLFPLFFKNVFFSHDGMKGIGKMHNCNFYDLRTQIEGCLTYFDIYEILIRSIFINFLSCLIAKFQNLRT